MAEGRIAGIVAGAAALLGVFATWQSTQNSASIEKNRVELERQQQDAEYRLAVFERVADAIENAESSPQQMRAAVLLVNTLPDDPNDENSLKKQLLVILVEGGVAAGGEAAEAVDAIRNETSDVPDAAVTKQVQAPAVAEQPVGASRAPASIAPTPGDLPATSVSRGLAARLAREGSRFSMRKAASWNIDVFYCEGAGAAQNEARAKAFSRSLEEEVQRQATGEPSPAMQNMTLGQVRLRPLTQEAFRALGYEQPSDFVRPEGSEMRQAEVLAALSRSAAGASPLSVNPARQPSPYYIGVYYCGGR
jgi:hypothetical protein